MTDPAARLSGARVRLVPASRAVAVEVVSGQRAALAGALLQLGLQASAGWPHEDTPDALRPLAEHGDDVEADACWLITVHREVVGECGWRPAVPGELELGYGLAAPARGRGLGTEAVGVLAAWADRQPGVALLSAVVLVGNEPSRRLLARLGFAEAGRQGDSLRVVRTSGARPRPAGRHVC